MNHPSPEGPVPGRPSRRAGLISDERGIITGFFIRLVFAFLLVLLVANEAGHVVLAKIRSSNAATAAAQAGSSSYKFRPNFGEAEKAAMQAATGSDSAAKVTSFKMNPDGTATVTIVVTADTLIVHRVSFLRHFGVQSTSATQGPGP